MDLIKIVHELRLAKGTLKKKEILRKHEENLLWKDVLVAMYDDSINYYTGVPNDLTFMVDTDYEGMLGALDFLVQRSFTGNAAKDYAKDLSTKYGEMVRLILEGTLKSGVGIETINAIYPGLIPTFPLMKGDHYEIVKLPILCSIKYDGIRLIATVVNGCVTLQTSSGKEVYISSLIHSMSFQPDGVYDGELVSGNGKQVGRTKITGQLNKCLFGTATDMTDYMYCIFDRVELAEWEAKVGTTSFYGRLTYMWETFNRNAPNVLLVQQTAITSVKEVGEWFAYLLSLGYEGLIGRYYEDVYVWDRTNAIIKQKAIKTAVVNCIGIKPGTGKYEGMVGSLLCEGEVDGEQIVVGVGSGLSDWDRDQGEEYFVDKKVEVMYNMLTINEPPVVSSLFLPRYKRVYGRIDT